MARGVLVITGPTATGKTALSVHLAKQLCGEVVSADAMQLYAGMVIGTAAPTMAERQGVPHHMVGVISPHEDYSVGRYVAEAGACIDDILARGKLPLLVGGTNLYIDSLLRGLAFSGGDPALRAALERDYDRLGGQALLERLAAVDPERAAKLAANDKKRIVRALEVWEATGQTITDHDRESRRQPPRYRSCRLALDFESRALLYARIDRRVERMLEAGLEAEVQALLEAGLSPGCTAMQAIGYKEMAAALRGECSLAAAVAAIQQSSRRYAKRQLSWLRRDSGLHWLRWKKEPNFQEAYVFSTQILENSDIL